MNVFNSPIQQNTILESFSLDGFVPVKTAATLTGYNLQYLRRLLRAGKLEGVKIGQVWLIRASSLQNHLDRSYGSPDHRLGPRCPQVGIPVEEVSRLHS
jgi:excisionase family DNA binding protein